MKRSIVIDKFCLAAEQRHKRMVEALRWANKHLPRPEPHTLEVSHRTEMLAEIDAILREEEGE